MQQKARGNYGEKRKKKKNRRMLKNISTIRGARILRVKNVEYKEDEVLLGCGKRDPS